MKKEGPDSDKRRFDQVRPPEDRSPAHSVEGSAESGSDPENVRVLALSDGSEGESPQLFRPGICAKFHTVPLKGIIGKISEIYDFLYLLDFQGFSCNPLHFNAF